MQVHTAAAVDAAMPIDHELAAIERELEFLLHVVPTNSAAAWTEFERNGYAVEPRCRRKSSQ